MFTIPKAKPQQTLRRTAIAAAVIASAVVTGTTTSHAAACLDDVSHWGRIADTKWQAKGMARAGMDWKIRNRLGDTVAIHRGTRISRCKFRDNDHGYGWQCKATIVVNRCY